MKTSGFSKGGLIATIVFFLEFLFTAASNTLLLNTVYVGGICALLVRSFYPPLTFGRGFWAWIGGGFAAQAVLGLTFLIASIFQHNSFSSLSFSEAIVSLLFGLPAYFLLRYGFKPIQFTKDEIADGELRKAIKLETKGELQKAREIYLKIVSSYADSPIAKDAESCLKALDNRSMSLK
jgi:hypothetical protein